MTLEEECLKWIMHFTCMPERKLPPKATEALATFVRQKQAEAWERGTLNGFGEKIANPYKETP